MDQNTVEHGQSLYRIELRGRLDAAWSDWFSGTRVAVTTDCDGQARTTLVGSVADQAALRGLLNKLWDLNLTLLSVARVGADDLATGRTGCDDSERTIV